MNILFVITSHGQLGDTGEKTGVWLEELVAPYYALKDAGHRLILASPKGGEPPIDPRSCEEEAQTDLTRAFQSDPEAKMDLSTTRILSEVEPGEYDAVFYPGGHGPLYDLAESEESKKVIEGALGSGKPVALVCHAPAVLKTVKGKDGEPLVKGKTVTGFTDEEEEKVGLADKVPFSLEQVLREQGADFQAGEAFGSYVVADGLLITGQNPASSQAVADALAKALPEG